MAIPEDKIIKIIDRDVHTRGVSVEQVGSQGALITKSVNDLLDNNNPLVLGYTSDVLTTLTKTVDGTDYVKTLTYTDGNLTGVSIWEEA